MAGNILPHIVSLLFRSLTSRPQVAIEAAYAALRDILLLASKGGTSDSQGTHNRLPKNLLQMCIRPVLLNLRDYTKLSIPLLRGLSRLLSLLSSWFSKTLGDKLLEHLQVRASKIYRHRPQIFQFTNGLSSEFVLHRDGQILITL